MPKVRLDQLLAGRELAADAREASALIMAGLVFSGTERLDKPGMQVSEDIEISVRSKEHPYVGRGGLKLQAALDHWGLDVKGMRAADLGSSTGGFTDCLLQRGADHVFAIDSGTNQLAWKLRSDPRVTSMEKTSARAVTPATLGGLVDLVVLDISFAKLEEFFEIIRRLLRPGGTWVALIKPQFEAERGQVPDGGVVIDAELQTAICERVKASAADAKLGPKGYIPSPIQGRDGNHEFLLLGQI